MSFELLKALSEAHGISGREGEVRAVVRAELDRLGLRAEEDALGNLIVDCGGKDGGPRALLDAHMDEIGMMVSHIHGNGAASFATIGGWDARNLPAQPATILTAKGKVRGVVGSKPPHISGADERGKAWKTEDLWIDVGAKSEAEARELGIEVGDPIVIDGPCEELRPGLIRGKAFDDRAGCYVILAALRALKGRDLPVHLFASFTVAEEVGTRGVRAIGGRGPWAAAIHLEATVAADVPGVAPQQCPSVFGGGPVITTIDNSIIVPERMFRFLEETARSLGIATQRKKPVFGGTNAGAMHQTGQGLPCGVISIPCRYIHSSVTLMKQSDLDAVIKLAVEAVAGIGPALCNGG